MLGVFLIIHSIDEYAKVFIKYINKNYYQKKLSKLSSLEYLYINVQYKLL
jgi:hypothetical protein